MKLTKHPLKRIIEANRAGASVGIYSCCSANEFVLRAALRKAKEHQTVLLVESTANQVDQFGGYSGMNPFQFRDYVRTLAEQADFPQERVILGGDHLGPLTFAEKDEVEAMGLARELIRQYVLAGFTKIHIDTSMRIGSDDKQKCLSDETIARRGAELCEVAEKAYADLRCTQADAVPPVYVIGSEVPIPGGAQIAESTISVTKASDLEHTINAFQRAFGNRGIAAAWERVIAVVVQPGVEFGSQEVFHYNHKKAIGVTQAIAQHDHLVLEGHSTDYQSKYALREMVQDGIAILKVGPALTFAAREGLFALEMIERELLGGTGCTCSRFRETLESAMIANDKYWVNHYRGSAQQQKFERAFSLSDRSRYYLSEKTVVKAIETLCKNLESTAIPYSLLHQYLPRQAERILQGKLENKPIAILENHIGDVIEDYLYATQQV